jgi:hypothetical protein
MVKIQVKLFLELHGRTYVGVQLLDGKVQIGQTVTDANGLSWIIREEQLASLAGQRGPIDKHLIKLEPIAHSALPGAGDVLMG